METINIIKKNVILQLYVHIARVIFHVTMLYKMQIRK